MSWAYAKQTLVEQYPECEEVLSLLEKAETIANAMGASGPILPTDVLLAYSIVTQKGQSK